MIGSIINYFITYYYIVYVEKHKDDVLLDILKKRIYRIYIIRDKVVDIVRMKVKVDIIGLKEIVLDDLDFVVTIINFEEMVLN